MTHEWEQFEGVSLAGEYLLEQWLGSDPTGAFFLTRHGVAKLRTVLKLIIEDGSGEARRLAWWQQTARLLHPNLLPLLDCGRAEYGDESLLYAVFESPDDSLGAALQNGSLTEQEGRDVMVAA